MTDAGGFDAMPQPRKLTIDYLQWLHDEGVRLLLTDYSRHIKSSDFPDIEKVLSQRGKFTVEIIPNIFEQYDGEEVACDISETNEGLVGEDDDSFLTVVFLAEELDNDDGLDEPDLRRLVILDPTIDYQESYEVMTMYEEILQLYHAVRGDARKFAYRLELSMQRAFNEKIRPREKGQYE